MSTSIDKTSFFLGIVAPENKDQVLFLAHQLVNYGVGKLFPALVLVGSGLVGTNSESGVEK